MVYRFGRDAYQIVGIQRVTIFRHDGAWALVAASAHVASGLTLRRALTEARRVARLAPYGY